MPVEENKSKLIQTDFNNFYRERYASLCSFANRYVNNPVLAEDIVGDVAIKVWEKKESLRNSIALRSYFYTSIRNTCLSHLVEGKRKSLKESKYIIAVEKQQPSIIENIIQAETFAELETAIQTLPAQCKKVFIKHFMQEKSFSEIAHEMNLSVSTIKNQRLRGIKLLRNKLTPLTTLLIMVLCLYL